MALSEMIESMNSVFKFASKLWADNKVEDKRKIIKEVFLFSCFAKNLNLAQNNKDFFYKDLLKNIYLNGKNHFITLNILNYACNPKIKLQEFKNTLNKILNSETMHLAKKFFSLI